MASCLAIAFSILARVRIIKMLNVFLIVHFDIVRRKKLVSGGPSTWPKESVSIAYCILHIAYCIDQLLRLLTADINMQHLQSLRYRLFIILRNYDIYQHTTNTV